MEIHTPTWYLLEISLRQHVENIMPTSYVLKIATVGFSSVLISTGFISLANSSEQNASKYIQLAQDVYRFYPFRILKGQNPFVPLNQPQNSYQEQRQGQPLRSVSRTKRITLPPKETLRYISDVDGFAKFVQRIRSEPMKRGLSEKEKDSIKKYVKLDLLISDIKKDPKFAFYHLVTQPRLSISDSQNNELLHQVQLQFIGLAAINAAAQLMLYSTPLVASYMYSVLQSSIGEQAQKELDSKINSNTDTQKKPETKPSNKNDSISKSNTEANIDQDANIDINTDNNSNLRSEKDKPECDKTTLRELQTRVNLACKTNKSRCLPGQNIDVLESNLRQLQECLSARNEVRRICFPSKPNDPNDSHVQQINSVKNGIKNCKSKIASYQYKSNAPTVTVPSYRIPALNGGL